MTSDGCFSLGRSGSNEVIQEDSGFSEEDYSEEDEDQALIMSERRGSKGEKSRNTKKHEHMV